MNTVSSACALRIVGLGVVSTLLGAVAVASPAFAASGDSITGVVWHDYDADGVRDPAEEGLEGVRVQAVAGDDRSDVVTTGPDGTYTLTLPTDAARWRVEASLPDDAGWERFFPAAVGAGAGTTNDSTVQFVDVADGVGAAGVDFSFHVPAAHVPQNPHVYLPEIQFGAYDGENADERGGTTITWDATGTNVPQTVAPTWQQVGATTGSTFVRSSDPNAPATALTSAYIRRHAGLGKDGIGAIYAVKPSGGGDWGSTTEADVSTYLDLAGTDPAGNSYGINLGGPTAAERPINDPNYNWVRDSGAYNYVGRAGLGLITMGADHKYLYAVNLNSRSLIRIDTDNDLTDPVEAAEVQEYHFPSTFLNDVRLFGVTVDPLTGTVYVTATDTGETPFAANPTHEGRTAARENLHGYIYSIDPDAFATADPLAADALLTSVLDFPLDYERLPDYQSFQPWESTVAVTLPNDTHYWPQPVVSTAHILHGDLIIGIRDRKGDLYGNLTWYSPVDGDDETITERAAGDVLIATVNDQGDYQLESNGIVPGKEPGAGIAPNAGGPGGNNYFDTRWRHPSQHEALGMIVVNPSREDGILSTAVHMSGGQDEGTRRFFQDTGAETAGALLRSSGSLSASFKGNGLGAATLLASAAPIEIGNYVWYDVDADGVQDASESPVAGATVHLYEVVDGVVGNTPVDTAVTNAAGEYYFRSTDDTYALKTGTEYVVALDNPQDYQENGPLFQWYPTVSNSGDQGSTQQPLDPDRNDSDGIVPVGGEFPQAAVSTGAAGENDHTHDFGFNQVVLEFTKSTVSGFPQQDPDDAGSWAIEYDLTVRNSGPRQVSYRLTDDLTGFGEGITVTDTEVLTGPAASDGVRNSAWNGGTAEPADLNVVTAEVAIAGAVGDEPTVHTYRLRVTVRLADAEGELPPASALTCQPDQVPGGETTGLFNAAVLIPDVGEPIEADECDDLPRVVVQKSVSADSPVVVDPVNRPGVYRVSYDVVVTNQTAVATDYDLSDQFQFGAGVSIVAGSAEVSAVDPALIPTVDPVLNPRFDGVVETNIVQDRPIAGSAVHSYSVSVEFTVDLPTQVPDPDTSGCEVPAGEGGARGLLNGAVVSFNGYPGESVACAPVGDVTHVKELVSAEPIGDGRWQVVYRITVRSVGAAPTSYTLRDELHFGDGITIVADPAPVVVGPADVQVNPNWTGAGTNTVVAEDVAIEGSGDAGYQPDVYQVTVVANVSLSFTTPEGGVDPSVCGADAVNYSDVVDRAFLNVSTLVDQAGDREDDDACAPVPHFALDKTVSDQSPQQQADGSWLVRYGIDVTNTSTVTGVYDLDDTLRFADDVQIIEASVTATTDGLTTEPSWTGQGNTVRVASGVSLPARVTHSYQVEVTVTVADPLNLVDVQDAFQCQDPGTVTQSGLTNEAVFTHNDLTLEDVVCPQPPGNSMLAMNKTIAAGPEVNADGSYSISYQIEVVNTGEFHTEYDLVDDLQFGDGFVVTSAEVTDAPEVATVLDTWTGLGEPGSASLLVARDVPILVGHSHTYTVTVTGTVPPAVFRNPMSIGCPPDRAYGQTGGFHNVAIVTSGMQELTDDVCEPPTPPTPPLAETGTDTTGVGIVAGIAGLLALFGVVLLASRRRKQADSS